MISRGAYGRITEASTSGEFEDIIDDTTYEYITRMERTEPEVFHISKEAIEAFINIFFNQEYNLNDYPFERGAEEGVANIPFKSLNAITIEGDGKIEIQMNHHLSAVPSLEQLLGPAILR